MVKSDEELLQEYAQGRREAFSELVERHLTGVYSFLLRFVGDAQDAQDISQETFVKAWRAAATYNAKKSSFKTWLLRVARNAAVDHLRRRRNISFSEFEGEHEHLIAETVADPGELPEELLAKAEDAQTVMRALHELPAKYREVLLLYYTNELTFEELGAMLGEPQNTIKSRHRRALIALREALGRDAPKQAK